MTAAEELPPFQQLRARRAGQPLDTALREEPPMHLVPFLQQWIGEACQLDSIVGLRAALSVELAPVPVRGIATYVEALIYAPHEQLLEVIDAILRFHGRLDEPSPWGSYALSDNGEAYARLLERLGEALLDARMAVTIADSRRQLVDRIDATVTAAAEQATASADPMAAELLRDAWHRVYGLHPDPTTAYRQAVRAVEEVLCPQILPRDTQRTLGKVIGHLREGRHKWGFVLVDKDGANTVEPLVAMLDRLWTGQVSRHGGGKNSRDQTQCEAEAAVHLAATLVQLLSIKALSRRSTS